MNAGKLRHLVEIQSATETTDSKGGYVTTWAAEESVWAQVQPIGWKDRWVHEQISPEVTHLVTVRYTSAVTTKSRIKWNNRYFNVVAIRNPEERNEMLVLMTKEDRS